MYIVEEIKDGNSEKNIKNVTIRKKFGLLFLELPIWKFFSVLNR